MGPYDKEHSHTDVPVPAPCRGEWGQRGRDWPGTATGQTPNRPWSRPHLSSRCGEALGVADTDPSPLCPAQSLLYRLLGAMFARLSQKPREKRTSLTRGGSQILPISPKSAPWVGVGRGSAAPSVLDGARGAGAACLLPKTPSWRDAGLLRALSVTDCGERRQTFSRKMSPGEKAKYLPCPLPGGRPVWP